LLVDTEAFTGVFCSLVEFKEVVTLFYIEFVELLEVDDGDVEFEEFIEIFA